MAGVKTVAALVSIVNGVWGIVAGAYWDKLFDVTIGIGPPPSWIVLILGVILLLDSLVCLFGFSNAFYASAAISLLIVVIEKVLLNVQVAQATFIGTLALALVTAGLDVVAARARKVIAEEDHPLNLPVFG